MKCFGIPNEVIFFLDLYVIGIHIGTFRTNVKRRSGKAFRIYAFDSYTLARAHDNKLLIFCFGKLRVTIHEIP